MHRANITDIQDHKGEKVLWVMGKGQDEKAPVILEKEVYQPLKKYLESRVDKNPALFVSESQNLSGVARLALASMSVMAKSYMKAAGMDDDLYSLHSTRHTAAIIALESTNDITQVTNLMRHSNINTTKIYLESKEQDRLFKLKPGQHLCKKFLSNNNP